LTAFRRAGKVTCFLVGSIGDPTRREGRPSMDKILISTLAPRVADAFVATRGVGLCHA
jgi:hypothetical protein